MTGTKPWASHLIASNQFIGGDVKGIALSRLLPFRIDEQLPEQVQAMQVISYTDARNSLKAVIDKVIDDQAPTLIHRREGGNAVLMSEEAYASMQETFYLMSNPANARALLRSIEQAKAGKAKKRQLLDV
jgi:antitoxin YefM